MLLHNWPKGLRWESFRATRGPQVIGVSSSLTEDIQTVMSPHGLVGFELGFPPLRSAEALAFQGLLTAFAGGADAVRFTFCNPARMSNDRIGFELTETERQSGWPWADGRSWADGRNWRRAPPMAMLAADAAEGAVELVLDVARWGGHCDRGTVFGLVGQFGLYTVQVATVSEALATVRIWPALRAAAPAGTLATLRPTLAVRLAPGGGSPLTVAASMEGAALSLVEVPDPVIRRYASIALSTASPWWADEAWRASDGTRPALLALYDQNLYAVPSAAAAALPTAHPAAVATLADAAFADVIALSAASTGTARTYVTAALGIGTDITADAPRFDYLRGGRRLLLEPAGTNLMTRASQANIWSTLASPNNVTVTANAATGPDGTSNADLVVPSTASGAHYLYRTFTGAVSSRHVFEHFFKAAGYRYVALVLESSGFAATRWAVFDLQTATITDTSGSNVAAAIDALGNGWVWPRIENDSDADGGVYDASIIVANAPLFANRAFAGDGTSGVYVWGAHVHLGPGPSMPIDTVTTTVTRAIETATAAAKALALVQRRAFTLVLVLTPHQIASGTIWQADDGTTDNRVTVTVASGAVTLTVVSGGTTIYQATAAALLAAGTEASVAIRLGRGRNALAVGGVIAPATTDTGAALPSGLTQAAMSQNLAGTLAYCAARWRRQVVYPAAVSDAALQALAA
jgi:hypothetical protein